MAYKAQDIANKLIYLAQMDEPNGGDAMTNLKLQKLLYYEQGYHLAAFGTPLFDSNIEAWMYGPVVPEVYEMYKDNGSTPLVFNEEPIALTESEEEIFAQVYEAFREFSAIGLMNRTHTEPTWTNVTPKGRGAIITNESMEKYFKNQLA